MKNQTTIFADQDSGLGDTATIIANFAAQIIPALFGGGKSGAKARDQKRAALAQIGFNWLQTSGVPAGQEWNIDNWPDVSLDNIANAVAKHGQVVVQLHNQQRFNPGNTQTMQQIDQVVAQYGGGSSAPGWNQGYAPVGPGDPTKTGFSPVGISILVIAGISILAVATKNQPPKKR